VASRRTAAEFSRRLDFEIDIIRRARSGNEIFSVITASKEGILGFALPPVDRRVGA
jgi:hypothetical protein